MRISVGVIHRQKVERGIRAVIKKHALVGRNLIVDVSPAVVLELIQLPLKVGFGDLGLIGSKISRLRRVSGTGEVGHGPQSASHGANEATLHSTSLNSRLNGEYTQPRRPMGGKYRERFRNMQSIF